MIPRKAILNGENNEKHARFLNGLVGMELPLSSAKIIGSDGGIMDMGLDSFLDQYLETANVSLGTDPLPLLPATVYNIIFSVMPSGEEKGPNLIYTVRLAQNDFDTRYKIEDFFEEVYAWEADRELEVEGSQVLEKLSNLDKEGVRLDESIAFGKCLAVKLFSEAKEKITPAYFLRTSAVLLLNVGLGSSEPYLSRLKGAGDVEIELIKSNIPYVAEFACPLPFAKGVRKCYRESYREPELLGGRCM